MAAKKEVKEKTVEEIEADRLALIESSSGYKTKDINESTKLQKDGFHVVAMIVDPKDGIKYHIFNKTEDELRKYYDKTKKEG